MQTSKLTHDTRVVPGAQKSVLQSSDGDALFPDFVRCKPEVPVATDVICAIEMKKLKHDFSTSDYDQVLCAVR